MGPGGTIDVDAVGRGGVPATGVSAVVVNVTAVGPTSDTHLTVFPTGSPRPNASNVNAAAGQTIANLVLATVGTNGEVDVYNNSGSTDVVVDVVGWFPISDNYHALAPGRLVDTRAGGTTADGQYAAVGAVGEKASLTLPVAGRANVPATGVGARWS